MWTKFRTHFTRAIAVSTLLSLTACGGGGTSFTAAKAPSISLSASTNTLPVQNNGYLYPDQTGLFNSRIVATVLNNLGNPVASGGSVQFTVVGGKTNVGSLFETDFKTKVPDPTNPAIQHPAAFWGLPVSISGSMAQVLFQAGTKTGTATITATYTDANGQSAQASTQIQVGSSVNTGLPSSFVTSVNNLPIYITGQNKNNQAVIDAYLYDPANQPIGSNGSNNIQAQIIGDNLGGASLVGANGQAGQSVLSQTVGSSGLAQITLLSGTKSGTLTVRLTADGADNNVDNGIQQAIVKDITVPISDGVIGSLSFASPFTNAIRNNAANVPLLTGETLTNGTYSRVISVTATDRNGNPVPNATVRFGLIDSPLTATSYPNPGFSPALPSNAATTSTSFLIQGTKGNPTEGGYTFSESDNSNLSSIGVHSYDRLILVPDANGTQRDMLSTRIISSLNGTNALTVTQPFPIPTTPGFIDGANIPWVIGRAQYGNIGATAVTDSHGVATTFMTYPVSRLNQPAILTAEATDGGVTSVFGAYYVGVAGGSLTSSVTSVPANTPSAVRMCAVDANKAPLTGIVINVGGVGGGVTISPSTLTTGSDGCVNFTINATVAPGGTAPSLTFSSGSGANETVTINVTAPSAGTLVVSIAGASSNSGADCTAANAKTRVITGTLLDGNGNPVGGQLVQFSLTSTDNGTAPTATICSANPVTATTGSNGQATYTVSYMGNTGDSFNVTLSSGATKGTAQPFPF
ncbi:MAG: hypothetical protein ACYC3A_01575 [Halothiobacillus sp.]